MKLFKGFAFLSALFFLFITNAIAAKILEENKPLDISLDKKNNAVEFTTKLQEKKYLSLVIEVEGGSCYISGSLEKKDKGISYKTSYSKQLYFDRNKKYILDDLPLIDAEMNWKIQLHNKTPLSKIKISMVSLGLVDGVSPSEEIGSLVLKGIGENRAEVSPEGGLRIRHPQWSSDDNIADKTPSGDALFWLPPGLWRVNVKPIGGNDYFDKAESRLVPVYANTKTIFYWPEMPDPETISQGVSFKIRAVEADKDQGEISFVIDNKNLSEPKLKNLSLKEGGKNAEIISLKKVDTPLDLVILLDSSGSMKKSMQPAIDAVASFIQSLPVDVRPRVVDFDSSPRMLQGGDRKDLLNKLNSVKANGATALNDSVILGLKELNASKRAALILFTDGKDANANDTGPGSKANPEKMFKAVKSAGVPIFTIGFGANPDKVTLERLASLTGGSYQDADTASVNNVFSKILNTLSSEYQLTYKRPGLSVPGDDPCLTIAVDTSGSMDTTPSNCKECGYKMENVKDVLHSFIGNSPDHLLVQLAGFSQSPYFSQILTKDKTAVSRGISALKAGGGTDIIKALKLIVSSNEKIASSRKYLVFVTDAALKVSKKDEKQFETLLGKIKDGGIYPIWVGMVSKKNEKDFKRAAKLSGGMALVSPEPEVLAKAMDAAFKQINKLEKSDKTGVTLSFNARQKDGRAIAVMDSGMFQLPPAKNEIKDAVKFAQIRRESMPSPYEGEVANLLYGTAMPIKDVRLKKSIELDVIESNKAINIEAMDLHILSRIRGVDMPSDRLLCAITLKFENILQKQKIFISNKKSKSQSSIVDQESGSKGKWIEKIPPYLIPDLKRHMFLRYNDEFDVPPSDLTTLAQTPLITEKDSSLKILPKETVTGTIIFTIPGKNIEKASLHFFDNNYGHIDLALIGPMTKRAEAVKLLPTKASEIKGTPFSVKMEKYIDTEKSLAKEWIGNGLVHRLIDFTIDSKVQALLDIDPMERMSLFLPTPKGSLYVKPSPVTELIFKGLYKNEYFSPGASQLVKQAYLIPEKTDAGFLMFEIKGEDLFIPLVQNEKPLFYNKETQFNADGIGMNINHIFQPKSSSTTVFDITFKDVKDGKSTRLRKYMWLASKKELQKMSVAETYKSRNSIHPSGKTGELIFGLDGKIVIPDGLSKRGVVVFHSSKKIKDYVLVSGIFKDLKQEIKLTPPPSDADFLLAENRIKLPTKTKDPRGLKDVIKRLQAKRDAIGWIKPGSGQRDFQKQFLGNRQNLSPPSIVVGGSRKWQETLKLNREAFFKYLQTIEFRPSSLDAWQVVYSPEAVISQNYGSAADLANMAQIYLTRQGVEVEKINLKLSAKEKKIIEEQFGYKDIKELPGLQSKEKKYVFPFNYATQSISNIQKKKIRDKMVTVKITVVAEKKALSAKAKTGMAGSALSGGGGSNKQNFTVFNEKFSLADLSLNPMDLTFIAGEEKKKFAVLESPIGRVVSSKGIPETYKALSLEVEIRLPDSKKLRPTIINLEGVEELADIYQCIGIALPDINSHNASILKEQWESSKTEELPDDISIIKWHGRSLLYKFIALRTKLEKELAAKLSVKSDRSGLPSITIVTTMRKGGKMVDKIDLYRTDAIVRTDMQEALYAFNLVSGFQIALLEQEIVNGIGAGTYLDPNNFYILNASKIKSKEYSLLIKNKIPKQVSSYLKESKKMILFPKNVPVINGKPQFAWFEMDQKNMFPLFIMEDGSRGAAAEKSLTDHIQDGASYVVGVLVGVSSSVWAVSSFSLEEVKYKEIISKSKEFAGGLLKNFNGIGGEPELTFDGSPYKVTLGGIEKDDGEDSSYRSFSDGYKAGVDYYFKMAEKE